MYTITFHFNVPERCSSKAVAFSFLSVSVSMWDLSSVKYKKITYYGMNSMRSIPMLVIWLQRIPVLFWLKYVTMMLATLRKL